MPPGTRFGFVLLASTVLLLAAELAAIGVADWRKNTRPAPQQSLRSDDVRPLPNPFNDPDIAALDEANRKAAQSVKEAQQQVDGLFLGLAAYMVFLLALAVVSFVAWLATIIWVYRDIQQRRENMLWLALIAFAFVPGLVVYLVVRQQSITRSPSGSVGPGAE